VAKTKMKQKLYAAVLSGVLLGLSYPSFLNIPTGFLAWFAFVPVLIVTRFTSNFKEYFFITFSVFLIAGPLNFWWTALYSWQAFFVCYTTQIWTIYLPFLLNFFIKRRYSWQTSLILLPFHWALIDSLTHQLPHVLQVNYIAYTQANNTWLIQFIDITGMWGATFFVITLNVLITNCFVVQEKVTILWKKFIPPSLMFGGALVYSFWVIKVNPRSVIGDEDTKTKVAIIQTNVDSYRKDSTTNQKVFDEIISLSDSAVRVAKPDLLVMPEAAMPIPLFQDTSLLNFTKKAIINWQTSVAIGFVDYPDLQAKSYKNNAIVFTPQLAMYWDSLKIKSQDVRVYQKEYGLPFIETMPYCDNCQTVRGDKMLKGKEPYIFSYSNFSGDIFSVALTICWEQMYPHKMTALVRAGAGFIALMNNDAWFGTSSGAKQLLSFTRMRAIENRRSFVRCSNGGISCFIDPYGQISGRLPWFTSTIGVQEVTKVNKISFYTKYPFLFVKLIAILLGVLLLYFERLKRKVINQNSTKI
jgi:apolipoprotein N-acyltransferase